MSKQPTITLTAFNAFVADLANHDWYYDYSDDINVYRRGCAEAKELSQQADSHPIYQQALGIYSSSVMSSSGSLLKRIELRERSLDSLRKRVVNEQFDRVSA